MTTAAGIARGLGARRAGPNKWKARCPSHKDQNPSLAISEGEGGRPLVHCHAGCEQSAVIEALRAKGLWGNDCERITTMRGATAEKLDTPTILLPVPNSAPPPPTAHPALGKPTSVWRYLDSDANLSFQVWRFDTEEGKEFRPLSYWTDGWHWRAVPDPRPLYNLDRLAADPKTPAVVTEGEKAADAAAQIFPKSVCTTSPGGSNAAATADWTPLKGRKILIWPDADQPGVEYGRAVADRLHGLGCEISIVTIDSRPEGWDAADAIAECPDLAALRREVIEQAKPYGAKEPPRRDATGTVQTALRSSSDVSVVPAWPQMDEAAYQGLAGEVVEAIEPHSEADPVAILIQFLTLAGNMMGRTAYYPVEDTRHHANLFAVLVGESSKARKGTSLGRVRAIMKVADQAWSDDRLKGGLSSGEGLINEVRDERREWNRKEGREEIADPGIADKRLMVVEAEFASALAVMERAGNTLSEHIRRAWDGDKLSTMTKHSPLCATGAYISMVGHITIAELRACLTRTSAANGFANRYLFPLVRRSKELPFGGSLNDSVTLKLGERLRETIAGAQSIGRVEMTDAAREQWAAVYSKLSAAQPGLLGAVVARAEAQVIRLALVYALLDAGDQIDAPHLEAALAVWEYCESSAAFIFGDLLGDPVADEIARALQHAGPEGLTRTAIRDLFGRNRSGDRIGAALALLATSGRAGMATRKTGGHPAEVWVAR
jgi:hypothetical protein